jgi:hypothetical protein
VGGGVIQIISEFVIAKTSYKFTFLLKLKIKLIKYYYYYRYKYNSLAKSPPSNPHSFVPFEETLATIFLILSNIIYHISHKTIFKFEETLANQPSTPHSSKPLLKSIIYLPQVKLSIYHLIAHKLSLIGLKTPLFFFHSNPNPLFQSFYQSFYQSFIALLITHLFAQIFYFSSPIYPIFFLF